MELKRMRIKEILRRIWLLSANKIKPSESMCKQLELSQVKLKPKLKLKLKLKIKLKLKLNSSL